MIRQLWPLLAMLSTLNIALQWRIFLPGITPYHGSIERGYAYMARWFFLHPNPWGWAPLQYCGMPAQFMYLPLLPYWNALWAALLPGVEITYIHRSTCAAALCLTPAAFAALHWSWVRDRRWAAVTGLALTLISPLYPLIATIARDRGIMNVPWRTQVLIKYGEGPHTFALFLLPLALIAVRHAAATAGFPALFTAAALLAGVVLSNWVAGLGAALLVLLLIAMHPPPFSIRRVLFAGLLGYGLAAFWLTPTFIFRMANNWPADAFGFKFQLLERYALLVWLAGIALLWAVVRKRGFGGYCALAAFTFGYPVALFYRWGLNTFPESRRYALEYEIFLVLAAVELFRALLGQRLAAIRWTGALAALGVLLYFTPQVVHYTGHRFARWQVSPKESSAEYRAAAALAARPINGRALLTGGTRFRANSWFEIPQTGGIFETGLRNRTPIDMAYQIRTDLKAPPGEEAKASILELQAMAAEYVVMHGPQSEEFYRDTKNPQKFDGVLDEVWRQGGDAIYRVPDARIAHWIKPSEAPTSSPRDTGYRSVEAYSDALRDSTRPTPRFEWQSPSAATIQSPAPAGMLLAVAINYDPGWHAWQDGAPIPVRTTPLGFLLLETQPRSASIVALQFDAGWEPKLFAVLSLLTWVFSLHRLWREQA